MNAAAHPPWRASGPARSGGRAQPVAARARLGASSASAEAGSSAGCFAVHFVARSGDPHQHRGHPPGGRTMNWKLILQLSMFGLAMGLATVFVIPSNIEPLFWIAIFVVCAYIIAMKCPGRYFLHGLMVSIVNSVWITASHLVLFDRYIANHAQEAAMMASMPLTVSPRLMMVVMGPVIGAGSGVVLGIFSVAAAKSLAARARRPTPQRVI